MSAVTDRPGSHGRVPHAVVRHAVASGRGKVSVMSTPANWYPDPTDPTLQRYWDGEAWTEHVAPAAGSAPADGSTLDAGQQADPAWGETSTGATAGTGGGFGAPHQMPSYLKSSTLFAAENLEVATTGRMTRQNPAVVKVTLGAPLQVTRGAMIAFQGDVTFAYKGSGAAKYLKSMATGEGLKLMTCEGNGELFVSHDGKKLHLLELGPGEQLSASSRALLGFDASIEWNIQMIKGGIGAMAAGGLFNVTLTGPGTVILASDWPVVLDTSEARTCVDPNAVVAWSAGLQITTKSSMSAGALIGRGSGEAFQLEFSPGGFVIVEPERVVGVA